MNDTLPPDYQTLIASDRVSRRTRSVLLARLTPPDPAPGTLSPSQTACLRAVLARVVPQHGPAPVDLLARVVAVLAGGTGDGWRVADQPADADAYRAALDTLDRAAAAVGASGFAALTDERQDALLRNAADGTLSAGTFGPERMKLWFEDVRSDATRAYVSDPRTLARLGFSGIGYGGDAERLQGFSRVGIGDREAWEPVATVEGAGR